MVEARPLYLHDDCVIVEEANLGHGQLVHLPTGRKFRFDRCEMHILKALLHQHSVEVIANELASQFGFDISLTARKIQELVGALVNSTGVLQRNLPSRRGSSWRKMTATPTLSQMYLELTNECNLRCLHCYVPARSHSVDRLSRSKVFELIDEAADLGVTNVYLTGGEAFILDDIWDIISYIDDRRFSIGIFSNGTLLSEKDVERLRRFSVYFFSTSLDGATASTHDTFRGEKGAFLKTVKTIRLLREAGMRVRVGITVTQLNYEELPRLFPLLKNLDTLFAVGGIDPAGRGKNVQGLNVGLEDLAAARSLPFHPQLRHLLGDRFDSMKDELVRQMEIPPRKPFGPSCGVGENMIYIDSSGFAGLCPTLTRREGAQFSGGNVYEQSLKEIWEAGTLFRLARNKMQCKDLLSCHFSGACGGGCRSNAFLAGGNHEECDRASYETYRRLCREIGYGLYEDKGEHT